MDFQALKKRLGELIDVASSDTLHKIWVDAPSSPGENALNEAYLALFQDGIYGEEQVGVFPLLTPAAFTTGTITHDLDSRAVTGSSTAWPTDFSTAGVQMHIGRVLVAGSGSTPHRIRAVSSGTALTLDTPNRDKAQPAGSSYKIYQEVFDLPPDFQKLIDVYDETARRMLRMVPEDRVVRFDDDQPAQPLWYKLWGTRRGYHNDIGKNYKNSTVTVANGSTTVTRTAGDHFNDPEDEGRMIRFGGEDTFYRVQTITSSTELKLETAYQGSQTTSTNALMSEAETRLLRLFPPPDTERLLTVRYRRRPWRMMVSTDEPELEEDWHELILWGAYITLFGMYEDIPKDQNKLGILTTRFESKKRDFTNRKNERNTRQFGTSQHNRPLRHRRGLIQTVIPPELSP